MKQLYQHLYIAGQISADDFKTFKSAGIKTVINNRPDNEEPNQLNSAEAAKLAQQNGLDYHYLPMANGQPMTATLVDDFKSIIDSTDAGVLAHCRSGMRSSFIWALGQIPEGNISVDEAIEKAQAIGVPLGNARTVLESVQA